MLIEINATRIIKIVNDGSSGTVGVGVGFAVGSVIGF